MVSMQIALIGLMCIILPEIPFWHYKTELASTGLICSNKKGVDLGGGRPPPHQLSS